ncbi:MAG TPA: hypothetical protein PKD70_10520 [Saprospiraceae bacterium]|nr:hypothetical protein [Saprospiraceae bacterium]HMP14304.1 hypothetical protein [Saprospiraceae bacterium]
MKMRTIQMLRESEQPWRIGKPFKVLHGLYLFCICGLLVALLSGCQTDSSRHTSMELFWTDFQSAVANDNRQAVARMTHFPLKGAEPYLASFDMEGISQAAFMEVYDGIFDRRTRQVIAAIAINELARFTADDESIVEVMGFPIGTEFYNFTVMYTFDEGEDIQTESSVTFHFAKVNGRYQLCFLLVAG